MCAASPPRASRVAAFFPFHACQRHYPDGSGSVPASLSSPSANGLPLKSGGSASVLSVSRPARRSLAFRPAWSLGRPWRPLTPECFRPYRCLHDPPWLLPTGATVVGRGSHPPEKGAFPRRTGPSWITLLLLSFFCCFRQEIDHPVAALVPRRGSPQRLSGPSWITLFSFVSDKGRPRPPRRGGSFEGETIRNRSSLRDLGIPSRLTSAP